MNVKWKIILSILLIITINITVFVAIDITKIVSELNLNIIFISIFGIILILLSFVIINNSYNSLTQKLSIKTLELKNSEKRYKTFFENSADAMLIIQNNLFIDCNNSAIKILKLERI